MVSKIKDKFKREKENIRKKIEVMLHGGVVTRFNTEEKIVALTFDDGPHPHWTPRLIDLLNKYDARATFFVVGTNAEEHPGIIKKAVETGHAIGNHTWDHPSLPALTTGERKINLQKCDELIGKYNPEKLFRPPWGRLDKYSRREILKCGYKIITWNIAVNDWENEANLQSMFDKIARKIKQGSIILLHDVLYDLRDWDRSEILILVEKIIDEFGDEYRFLSIPEMEKIAEPVFSYWDFR